MHCRASRAGDRRRIALAAGTTLASFERSQVADVLCDLRMFPAGPTPSFLGGPSGRGSAHTPGRAGPGRTEAIATTSNWREAAERRSGGLERGNPNSWLQFEL